MQVWGMSHIKLFAAVSALLLLAGCVTVVVDAPSTQAPEQAGATCDPEGCPVMMAEMPDEILYYDPGCFLTSVCSGPMYMVRWGPGYWLPHGTFFLAGKKLVSVDRWRELGAQHGWQQAALHARLGNAGEAHFPNGAQLQTSRGVVAYNSQARTVGAFTPPARVQQGGAVQQHLQTQQVPQAQQQHVQQQQAPQQQPQHVQQQAPPPKPACGGHNQPKCS
jgi:hypothetical protein